MTHYSAFMTTLRRTVRLVINPLPPAGTGLPSVVGKGPTGISTSNPFAGSPSMAGLGRYYEFDVAVSGVPAEGSGYLIDIRDVDRAVRSTIAPALAEVCDRAPWTEPAGLIVPLAERLRPALPERHRGGLASLRWHLTPFYSVEAVMSIDGSAPPAVVIRQRFDFAAAHRLHLPNLSDEANRSLFGKCNNPSGHGHNYMLEPAVEIDTTPAGLASSFSLPDLERLTKAAVIDRFDHTHLNLDTAEFAFASGLNPSVEHIAMVCHGLLRKAMEREFGASVRLRSVTVWETDRTSATFPGN
jgi:6-pyruvoyltetrahydropterin/6-carboxytetrahydropterin synthase